MAIELISFDDLQLFLGLSESKGESDYPDLTLIQESVVDAIAEYTRRELEFSTYTRVDYIHDRTQMLQLPAIPVSEVISFTVDGADVDDYVITSYGIFVQQYIQQSTISVTYKGGLNTVPAAVKRAALLQTVYEYQNKDSVGIEVVNSDGGSVVKPALGLLDPVKRLLHRYKHPGLVL